jgi:hypothetical protein
MIKGGVTCSLLMTISRPFGGDLSPFGSAALKTPVTAISVTHRMTHCLDLLTVWVLILQACGKRSDARHSILGRITANSHNCLKCRDQFADPDTAPAALSPI